MDRLNQRRARWGETIDLSADYTFGGGGFIVARSTGTLVLEYFGDEAAGRTAHTITVVDNEVVDYALIKKVFATSTVTSADVFNMG